MPMKYELKIAILYGKREHEVFKLNQVFESHGAASWASLFFAFFRFRGRCDI